MCAALSCLIVCTRWNKRKRDLLIINLGRSVWVWFDAVNQKIVLSKIRFKRIYVFFLSCPLSVQLPWDTLSLAEIINSVSSCLNRHLYLLRKSEWLRDLNMMYRCVNSTIVENIDTCLFLLLLLLLLDNYTHSYYLNHLRNISSFLYNSSLW